MTRTTLSISFFLMACGSGQASTSHGPAGADQPSSGAEAAPAPAGDARAAIESALAGPQRSAENRARDAQRHPLETLTFFGLQPGMKVVELSPGEGWYTELLAPVLCQSGGAVRATIPALDGPGAKYAKAFMDRVAQDPALFSCVEAVPYTPAPGVEVGAAGWADLVLTFRNTHGWINNNQVDEVYAAVFRVLKPGGIFGVVQHRADEGADPKLTSPKGYVAEKYLIELAEKAGFVFVGSSDINRNPRDTHDHPEGVWTLPPNLRLGEVDKAKYLAIGESDRATLKFQKPAQ
jgi:predicted methyltransferase